MERNLRIASIMSHELIELKGLRKKGAQKWPKPYFTVVFRPPEHTGHASTSGLDIVIVGLDIAKPFLIGHAPRSRLDGIRGV